MFLLPRLRNTSEALTLDPPAAQHLISSTDTRTLTFDLTGHSTNAVTVKSGSDPIRPSLLPILTSTQEDTLHRKSNRSLGNQQTEVGSDSVPGDHVGSHPEKITSASEQGRHFYKNKQVQEKMFHSQERIQESETQEKNSNSDPSGSEFQKTSKTLRDKRDQQPVPDYQQTTSRNNILSYDQPGRAVSDPDLIQDNLSTDEDKRSGKEDLTRMKTRPAVRRRKMVAEAAEAGSDTDLQAKLSDFLFKPKKMRLLDLSSTVNLDPRGPQEHSIRKKIQVQEGVCASDVGGTVPETGSASNSERPQKVFSFQKDRTLVTSPISENKTYPGEQRSSTIMSTCSPGPFKPDRVRPAVSASTVAKLSRFSFGSTTGPKTTPGTAAEPKTTPGTSTEPKATPLMKVELGRRFDSFKVKFKVQEALSCTPSQTRTSLVCSGNVDDGLIQLPPAAEHLEQRPRQTEFPVGNTVNLRKRKCFRLSPPDKKILSKSSLFASTDLFPDVLDTDWDQEVLKTNKV